MAQPHGSILHDLAYLTECQLATLEEAKLIKRTSKSQLGRYERIANWGVNACMRHGLLAADAKKMKLPRLEDRLTLGGATA